MNKYLELKKKHEKELNDFPIKFAFGNEQFKNMMESFGLTENDTDKIVSIGFGGYVKKENLKAMEELFKSQADEMKKALEDDNFLESAFNYEMGNHEYIITYDKADVFRALGLSINLLDDERVYNIFKKAESKYLEDMEKLGW